MSAYEQKVEVPDKKYQYLLFACDPYEIIAFKIPNVPIDKKEGKQLLLLLSFITIIFLRSIFYQLG